MFSHSDPDVFKGFSLLIADVDVYVSSKTAQRCVDYLVFFPEKLN